MLNEGFLVWFNFMFTKKEKKWEKERLYEDLMQIFLMNEGIFYCKYHHEETKP